MHTEVVILPVYGLAPVDSLNECDRGCCGVDDHPAGSAGEGVQKTSDNAGVEHETKNVGDAWFRS
jgi:hypothetical protein